MSFGAYQESAATRRLSGNLERRGSRIGFSTSAMVIIAFLIMCLGSSVFCAGRKIIPIDASTLHGPFWTLTVIGLVTFGAGIALLAKSWRQFIWNRHRAAMMKLHPNEPALADYAWDERGFTPPHWKKVANTFVGVVFLTIFLSVFDWWAFLNHGPIPVKITVGAFDVLLLYGYWLFFLTIGRAIKFGNSRIEFAHFPYQTDESIQIVWYAPSGMTRVTGGTFTLRCVKEWYETFSSGRNQRSYLVQEEQWSGAWPIEQPEEFFPGKGVDFTFQPSPNLPSTNLNAQESTGTRAYVNLPGYRWSKTYGDPEPVVFWEFEVKLQFPGLDFQDKYLVPVYESASARSVENERFV